MKKRKVINSRNLPAKLPIWQTLTTFLALDHWSAPAWLWGALGVIFLTIWIISLILVATQEELDILKTKE